MNPQATPRVVRHLSAVHTCIDLCDGARAYVYSAGRRPNKMESSCSGTPSMPSKCFPISQVPSFCHASPTVNTKEVTSFINDSAKTLWLLTDRFLFLSSSSLGIEGNWRHVSR